MKHYTPAGDQPAGISPGIHRRSLIKPFCLVVIWLGFTIGGCDFRKADAAAETNSEKESNMESTQTATPIQPKIPPIDAAAVSDVKTATFALG